MSEWKVLFDTSFWGSADEKVQAYEVGDEIAYLLCTAEHPVNQTVLWCGETWKILSCYTCQRGMVIDYCRQIDPKEMAAFVKKSKAAGLEENFDEELFEKLQLENPAGSYVNVEIFRGAVQLKSQGSSSIIYYPRSIDGVEEAGNDPIALKCMEHYGLDVNNVFSINRAHYFWDEGHEEDLSGLSVTFQEQEVSVPGEHFTLTGGKQDIFLTHPYTGKKFTLHIESIEAQEISAEHFAQLDGDAEIHYPTHYEVISYYIEPELPHSSFYLKACAKGDSPIRKVNNEKAAAAIAVIGGASGPTSVFVMGKNKSEHRLQTVCSPLFFAPTPVREWYICYRIKRRDDLTVDLNVSLYGS